MICPILENIHSFHRFYMIHHFTTQMLRSATLACSLCVVACTTPILDLQRPSQAPASLQLTQEIAQRLSQLNNEMHVSNILYVTQDKMMIGNIEYTLLSFHTGHSKVFRTRVETSKLNQATFERLKLLKGATFIGVLPIEGHSDEYFFRNYKNLKF